jgi:outer membrane protein insertion porin family
LTLLRRRFPLCGAVVFLLACTAAGLFFAATAASAQESGFLLSGKPIAVHSVQFTGNKNISSDKLEPLLTTQGPGFFYSVIPPYRLFSSPPYLKTITVSLDSLALWTYYRHNGYLHARIMPSIAIDTPNLRADITFAIAESTACLVDTIQLNRLNGVSDQIQSDVEHSLTLLQGKRYVQQDLMDTINYAVNYLRNNGYIYAHDSSSPRVTWHDESESSVNISVTVATGKKYYFGRIDIAYDSSSGDFCFAENAVLKELEFSDGDLYSEAKRARSEENLKRLGSFEVVHIEILTRNADSSHHAPVRINLKLKPKWDFNPTILCDNNYSTTNVGASATVADHNVGCAGQDATLSSTFEVPVNIQPITILDNRFTIEAKFLQPRLQWDDILDYKNTSGQLGVGYTHAEFHNYNQDYTQFLWNVSALLSIRQAEYTYLSPKLAFIYSQIYNLNLNHQDSIALLSTNPQFIFKQPNLLASITLTRDNTNSLFVPSQGSSGVLALTANLLSTPYFLKVEATQKWYVEWGTQSVFAFRVHGGAIGRYHGNTPDSLMQDVLFEQKFYVGGAYSMRGWPLYGLGIGIDSNSVFGRSGYTLFEANAEWRYKWFILPDTWINRVILNRISSDFFIDAGDIWGERQKWQWVAQMPQQLALAVGAGLRYDTPVGPLRVDFGFKLYDPYSQTFQRITNPQIQIAIGNAF